MAKTKKELSQKEREQVARALEILFATGFVDRKKLYIENFIRGLTFSIGSIIGATIGLAIVLWILSLFVSAPLIGPLIQNAQQTIQNSK